MAKEDADYYINSEGYMVFTANYHLKRGYCCKNKCKHCPWNFGKTVESENDKKK